MSEAFRPEALYFGVARDEDEDLVSITLCPRAWWDERGCLFENHIKLEGNTVPWLDGEPDMECTWCVYGIHEDLVRQTLINAGYCFNPEFEPWRSPPVNLIPMCQRPTAPGLFLCQRVGHQHPEAAEITESDGKLMFYSGPSAFPLERLEPEAQFWGPIQVVR